MNATGSLAVMIADDEAPARRKLARFLGEHDDVEVVAEAANGLDALDLIAMTKPALLFLDINMPDLDGIGVAEALARADASNSRWRAPAEAWTHVRYRRTLPACWPRCARKIATCAAC